MEKLPLEITANIILSRLPIFSQLQCREVCKTWRNLVNPRRWVYFTGFHTTRQLNLKQDSTFQNNTMRMRSLTLDHRLVMRSSSVFKSFMVGSCNGLVCYAGLVYYGDYPRILEIKIYVCNPVTGEHIQLPIVKWGSFDSTSNPGIGFGYNHSRNEYKVVLLRDNIFREVQLYTLLQGGTVWRYRSCRFYQRFLSHLSVLPSTGVFAGGALHWIDQGSTKPKTAAFNLESEIFELLPSIASLCHEVNHVELMVLGDNLCAIEVVPTKHVMAWESGHTQEQGVSVYTWVTKFSIAWEHYGWFEPVALTKSDKCLLWHNAVLSCYDPETKTLRKLDETWKKFMGDSTPSICTTNRATPHVNSLVSLKEFMEERSGKKRKADDEIIF